jgi:hypothetical protein
MPQNFIGFDREQVLLMPPDLRDWLPEDHLAWTILESVAEMDLSCVLRGVSTGRSWSPGVRAVVDGLSSTGRRNTVGLGL